MSAKTTQRCMLDILRRAVRRMLRQRFDCGARSGTVATLTTAWRLTLAWRQRQHQRLRLFIGETTVQRPQRDNGSPRYGGSVLTVPESTRSFCDLMAPLEVTHRELHTLTSFVKLVLRLWVCTSEYVLRKRWTTMHETRLLHCLEKTDPLPHASAATRSLSATRRIVIRLKRRPGKRMDVRRCGREEL